MDSRDREIIELLRKNSRYTNTEIGNILGVSEGTVRKRVSRMLSSHIIRRFTIETSNDGVDGIVLVRVDLKKARDVILQIKKKYTEIYEFSGKIDIAVGIHSTSLGELNSAVDEIRSLDGVKSTDTLIRLV
ncbi:MAG: transcriptional regulator [Thermoplasmatales archaeon B_DKE]|nr:MAG: transcriptional regulator [Thermoplasmatales archaeon B_DKE]QRF74757.1 HTH-type transcriptional regulator LysM [Thermoplasmatales archaeon]